MPKSNSPRVAGYRVELPDDELTADFNEDSRLELTPELVGPTITHNQGIIGQGHDLTVEHLDRVRPRALLYNLTLRLLYNHWRDPNGEPELHLFGQLKRIAGLWLKECFTCRGGTFPAQLMIADLADLACERISAAITPRRAEPPAGEGHARPLQPDRHHPARQLHHVPAPSATRQGTAAT